MFDKDRLLRKLTELDTYRIQISEFSELSAAEYRSDWKTQRIVERTLQLMIELSVDIAHQIILAKQLPVPTDYANIFEILNQSGLISRYVSETMVRITNVRKVLGYQPNYTDATSIIKVLHHHLDDFARFRYEIITLLQ